MADGTRRLPALHSATSALRCAEPACWQWTQHGDKLYQIAASDTHGLLLPFKLNANSQEDIDAAILRAILKKQARHMPSHTITWRDLA